VSAVPGATPVALLLSTALEPNPERERRADAPPAG
jgi:hypothetical protein